MPINLICINALRIHGAAKGAVIATQKNSADTTFFSLGLLRRIPCSQRITAQELHQQLTDAGIERNVRTIQRQLERFSQYFDLECDDRCRPYGWRWRVGSRGQSMAQLSPAELLLMLDGFLATFGSTISNNKRDTDNVRTEQENNNE